MDSARYNKTANEPMANKTSMLAHDYFLQKTGTNSMLGTEVKAICQWAGWGEIGLEKVNKVSGF